MLKIRFDQYEALKEAYRDLYLDRTSDYFRRNWPDETADLDDEQLGDLIHDARGRAELYGINIEADVVRFTEIWLVLGTDFDRSPEYPWAAVVLNDEDTDGTIKVEQLAGATAQVLSKTGDVA